MASRVLYRSLSSFVESSFLDDARVQHQQDDGTVGSYVPSVASYCASPLGTSPRVTPRQRYKQKMRDINEPASVSAKQQQRQQQPLPADRHLISFVVVYTMIFFNGCCFTAVVPSVPFYLQVLGAPPSFLAYVVSFYSVGQIIGSTMGGYLTVRYSCKRLLTMSSTLGVLSSLLYAVAPGHWLVLLSRLLTGISAGMEFTTELTYISHNTTTKERTTFMASITACNVIGFIMGPAIAGALATLNFRLLGIFTVDQYTGPGWLLVSMFLADLAMVRGLFQEQNSAAVAAVAGAGGAHSTPGSGSSSSSGGPEEELTEQRSLLQGVGNSKEHQPDASYGGLDDSQENGIDDEEYVGGGEIVSTLSTVQDEPPPSVTLVLSMLFVQFTVMCAWSVLETITSPLAQDNFGWDVKECNLLFTLGGVVSLGAYVAFVLASKWVQDRWLIVYALVLSTMGIVLAIDWQQLGWVPGWVSILLPPYLGRFVSGYMVMNAGFMTGRPVTFALYSKLIASQYQGKYLGFMVTAGSAARTLGPFGAVFVYYGIEATGYNLLVLFGSVGIFHLVCLVAVIYEWPHLLPLPGSPEPGRKRPAALQNGSTGKKNGAIDRQQTW